MNLQRLYRFQPSKCSLFIQKLQARRLSTTKAEPSRIVKLSSIASQERLFDILDKNRVGAIEEIEYDEGQKQGRISFMGSSMAQEFMHRVMSVNRGWKIQARYEDPSKRPTLVEVVAAVGFRKASRRIHAIGTPANSTESELREEFSRFGEIEILKISTTNPKDATKAQNYCIVQFYSIESAMLAIRTLRSENPVARIVFAPDNYDKNLKRDMATEKDASEHMRAVSLRNFGPNMSINTTVASLLMNAKLPPRGENVESLRIRRAQKGVEGKKGKSAEVIVTFIQPTDALVFWNVANRIAQEQGQGIVRLEAAELTPYKYYIARAVELGATRTLVVYNIKNWEGLTDKEIRGHFEEFGGIYAVKFAEAHGCVFIKFADIVSAMRAVDRIWSRNCVFHPPYAGTTLGFAAEKRMGNAPIRLSPLHLRVAE